MKRRYQEQARWWKGHGTLRTRRRVRLCTLAGINGNYVYERRWRAYQREHPSMLHLVLDTDTITMWSRSRAN